MERFADMILVLCAVVPWILGIAVAKGFWLTLGAALFPPLAWGLLGAVCLAIGILAWAGAF